MKSTIPHWLPFFSGLSASLPFEIRPGFYLSYVGILIILPFLSIRLSGLLFFIGLAMTVVFSSLVHQSEITTLINPILLTFLLACCRLKDGFPLQVLQGASFGFLILLIMYIYPFIFDELQIRDILSYIITDRLWAADFNPVHGNGLALVVLVFVLCSPPLFYTLISLLVGLFSGSRIGLIAIVCTAFSWVSRVRGSYRLFVVVSAISAGGGCSTFLVVSENVLASELIARLSTYKYRMHTYDQVVELFLANPIIGVGGGAYGPFNHAHNSLAHMFVMYGLIGGCLYLLILIRFFSTLKYRWHAVVLFLVSMVQLLFHNPGVVLLLMALPVKNVGKL